MKKLDLLSEKIRFLIDVVKELRKKNVVLQGEITQTLTKIKTLEKENKEQGEKLRLCNHVQAKQKVLKNKIRVVLNKITQFE
jgi:hypothetical protein